MRAWATRPLRVGVTLLLAALAFRAKADSSSPLLISSLSLEGGQARARAESGETRTLGLDEELQRAAVRALEDARALSGAVVLVDVSSGQVLAVAEVGVKAPGDLLLKPNAPAASLFKIVTTTALYERGHVGPKDRVCTRGGLRNIDATHLEVARGPGAVCAPFQEALAVSRNAAYAQLSTEKLKRTDLLEVAEAFGFNSSLPLDLVGEVGLLEVPFNDLDFARTAAGFENSSLSVFGATGLALTIASGGAPQPMHLSAQHVTTKPERIIDERTASRIRRSMELAVQSGTAHDAFVNERGQNYLGYIQVAGKTGTLKPNRTSPTSSWFIGFAPSQKPTVAVGLLLKISDHWHKKAATTARDLLRYYFARRGARNVTFPFELSTNHPASHSVGPPKAVPSRTEQESLDSPKSAPARAKDIGEPTP